MEHPARRYYNPDLTDAEERALLRRNYLLLQTSQAARGLIGRQIVGVAVEPGVGEVVLHIAVRKHTTGVDEDVEEIAADLDALLQGGPEQTSIIVTRVHVGDPDQSWPGWDHAVLYAAKREHSSDEA